MDLILSQLIVSLLSSQQGQLFLQKQDLLPLLGDQLQQGKKGTSDRCRQNLIT